MKTYSVQERTQELLHMLRTHKGVRISGMAEKLSVTERTIPSAMTWPDWKKIWPESLPSAESRGSAA